jgi:hypothetical protein
LISGVKWLQFDSDFDAMAIQLREEAVRRFATGADVPAEILLGLGDASHWGAWALTAEALRMGAEPRLALVCSALTNEWLRPLLKAEGDPDADTAMVWYDTSGLRSSSNKGASAIEAYKENLISDQAARRELGFTEMDAPEGGTPRREERGTTEGTDIPVNETQAPPAEPGLTDPATVGLAAAGTTLDSFTADASAALVEAVDGLVWGALTNASRRITLTPLVIRPERAAARALVASGSVHTRYNVKPEDVVGYKLLEGAWVRVPDVAARYGIDGGDLAAALDSYVTGLLVTGTTHSFDHSPRLLAQLKVAGLGRVA